MAKKKSKTKPSKAPAFKRKVNTITNKMKAEVNVVENVALENIVLPIGTKNHNWVSREYGITICEAKTLIEKTE